MQAPKALPCWPSAVPSCTTSMYGRAADKYAAAVTAAAALQPVDNMVVATNQARKALSLLAAGYDFFNTASALDAARTEVVPLLRAAMDVAQRRKDAGTLRAGACTAFETAYEAAFTRESARMSSTSYVTAADVEYSVSVYTALFGYRCYIAVGSAAVSFIALAVHHEITRTLPSLLRTKRSSCRYTASSPAALTTCARSHCHRAWYFLLKRTSCVCCKSALKKTTASVMTSLPARRSCAPGACCFAAACWRRVASRLLLTQMIAK